MSDCMEHIVLVWYRLHFVKVNAVNEALPARDAGLSPVKAITWQSGLNP